MTLFFFYMITFSKLNYKLHKGRDTFSFYHDTASTLTQNTYSRSVCVNEWINELIKDFPQQRNQAQITKQKRGKHWRPSRWQRSKMWRSPSSAQIHQKYTYMWNNSYRTPTECWQKTPDIPKGKKLHTYLGRVKEKRKNRDKRIGTGPAAVGGSCEGGKVSTH